MGSLWSRAPASRRVPHGTAGPAGRDRDDVPARAGLDARAHPGAFGALLAAADGGTRARVVHALQQRHGNAAVQRLLRESLPVQRWPVRLPAGTADCGVVVDWMNANSPYRRDSGWARTNASFRWGGDPAFSSGSGPLTATVANPTVTKSVAVDMPSWAPTDPAMRSAWTAMTGNLRAHEAQHEAIATTWDGTLRQNLRDLSVSVSSRSTSAFTSAVQAEWNGWVAQHQADQRAIDPYSALLDCGGGAGTGSSGGGRVADLSGLDEEADLGGL